MTKTVTIELPDDLADGMVAHWILDEHYVTSAARLAHLVAKAIVAKYPPRPEIQVGQVWEHATDGRMWTVVGKDGCGWRCYNHASKRTITFVDDRSLDSDPYFGKLLAGPGADK
jgi:predicted type IV restriction endonuclease